MSAAAEQWQQRQPPGAAAAGPRSPLELACCPGGVDPHGMLCFAALAAMDSPCARSLLPAACAPAWVAQPRWLATAARHVVHRHAVLVGPPRRPCRPLALQPFSPCIPPPRTQVCRQGTPPPPPSTRPDSLGCHMGFARLSQRVAPAFLVLLRRALLVCPSCLTAAHLPPTPLRLCVDVCEQVDLGVAVHSQAVVWGRGGGGVCGGRAVAKLQPAVSPHLEPAPLSAPRPPPAPSSPPAVSGSACASAAPSVAPPHPHRAGARADAWQQQHGGRRGARTRLR